MKKLSEISFHSKMYRPRIVPVLLLRGEGLYKSIKFGDHRYIGDPINALRIFDSQYVDEIILLDILASSENRSFSPSILRSIGDEIRVPFCVGGGFSNLEQIEAALRDGAERVILNTIALISPRIVEDAVKEFGSSTISVCIDVRKSILGHYRVFSHRFPKQKFLSLADHIVRMQGFGVGELIVQSVDNDGMMSGFDVSLMKKVYESSSIPVTAVGGAGDGEHLLQLARQVKLNGYGCGSLFVYKSKMRGVLINYPDIHFKQRLQELF